jgi:hypothetical protein
MVMEEEYGRERDERDEGGVTHNKFRPLGSKNERAR